MEVFADRNIPFLKDALEGLCDIEFFDADAISNADLKKADAVFCRTSLKINADLLRNTPVKFVATATSGIDHFDIDYLESEDIAYSNALGSNAASVAEYVMYSIAKFQIEKGVNLSGKTIGIIGCGNVGSLVAKHSLKSGLDVLINDPPKIEAGYALPDSCRHVELDKLLAESDIITNHVPRTYSGKFKTINLLNAQNMELIKDDTLFIHASRGKVVDEAAFIEISARKNITAVFDVWEEEPHFNRKLARKCLLAGPHIAGHSLEGKVLGTKMVLQTFENFTGGAISPDYSIIDSILGNRPGQDDSLLRDTARLYRQVKENRKLEEDHDFLLNLPPGKTPANAKAFSDYRQNYPERRETLQ